MQNDALNIENFTKTIGITQIEIANILHKTQSAISQKKARGVPLTMDELILIYKGIVVKNKKNEKALKQFMTDFFQKTFTS